MQIIFDHERLDVYQVSIQFAVCVSNLAKQCNGTMRNVRDQLLRASQSIPLNIAEGNGKRSYAHRRRYLEIARGSAMESAAALDILVGCGAFSGEVVDTGKKLLLRIISMLSKMTEQAGSVREEKAEYLEHEHEGEQGGKP